LTRSNARTAERCVEYDARETHAPRSRPEKVGITVRSYFNDRTIGKLKMKRLNVVAPRAFEVVVLAMNVRSNGSTDGDIPGTGGDGNKQSLGDKCLKKSID